MEDKILPDIKIKKQSSFGIANNLRKLMERANISEHELSRRTNVTQPIIHRLLSGANQNPKLLTLKPIADYFMLTVSQLIGEIEIESVWNGFTAKEHKGWSEIPLINYDNSFKNPPNTLITESKVSNTAFALHIIDQSMEPLFPENCIVIVEPAITPRSGDAVIFSTATDAKLLRNLILIGDEKYVTPLNTKFGTISKLSSQDRILGTVIRTIYDLRLP